MSTFVTFARVGLKPVCLKRLSPDGMICSLASVLQDLLTDFNRISQLLYWEYLWSAMLSQLHRRWLGNLEKASGLKINYWGIELVKKNKNKLWKSYIRIPSQPYRHEKVIKKWCTAKSKKRAHSLIFVFQPFSFQAQVLYKPSPSFGRRRRRRRGSCVYLRSISRQDMWGNGEPSKISAQALIPSNAVINYGGLIFYLPTYSSELLSWSAAEGWIQDTSAARL